MWYKNLNRNYRLYIYYKRADDRQYITTEFVDKARLVTETIIVALICRTPSIQQLFLASLRILITGVPIILIYVSTKGLRKSRKWMKDKNRKSGVKYIVVMKFKYYHIKINKKNVLQTSIRINRKSVLRLNYIF